MESGSLIETLEDGCVEGESHSCDDKTLEQFSASSPLSVKGKENMINFLDGNREESVRADEPKEVPKEGISLVVEVFGPLNGTGTGQNNQEHKFSVGDLVWVKTKSSLWWPGIISHSCDQTGSFVVKHFGNIISSRFPSSQLKPFIDCFDPMSQQTESRSFLGAVEKAVVEIGHRVKQEMLCPCFPPPREGTKRGKFGIFSASEFDPTEFLESIRNQAVDTCRPGSIQFAVMKNCLSAFYYSLGHKHLSLHKLRPRNEGSDCNSDAKEEEGELNIGESSKLKNENSFDLRERKKSKYLSHPYINRWGKRGSTSTSQEEETKPEDLEVETEKLGEQSAGNLSTGRNPRRRCRSFKSIYSKLKSVDHTSLPAMLKKLHFTALDCLYPLTSKRSASAMNFFYNFRKHLFLNLQQKQKQRLEGEKLASVANQTGSESGKRNKTFEGVKVQKNRKKMVGGIVPEIRMIDRSPDLNGNTVRLSVENMEVIGPDTSKGKLKPKRAKNKDTVVFEVPPHAVPTMVGPNTVQNDGLPITSPSPAVKPEPNKRMRKEKEPYFQNSLAAALLDLNGNSTGLPAQKKRQRRINSNTTSGFPGNALLLNFAPGHPLPSKESLIATFIKFGQVVETETQFLSDSCARIVFTQSCEAEGAYKSLEMGSLLGSIIASYVLVPPNSSEKSAKTPRPKKSAAGGPTLVLNFAPGHPTPSKESLKETFSKWGPVMEPETHFISESRAQVVFEGSGYAEVAWLGLQKSNPFGPALASYRLNPNPPRCQHKGAAPDLDPPTTGGSTLLLSFFPGHPLPTKQSLVSSFAKFGQVLEPMTQFTSESTARVVFLRGGGAEAACKGLEKSNPFGPALATFREQSRPVAVAGVNNSAAAVVSNSRIQTTTALRPMGNLNLQAPLPSSGRKAEGPDIMYMKKNLEMMRDVLDREGDSIQPEMKAKLESDIKGFLNKLNSMVGASSSSS
ncbi:unnamed protein product [Cuscuta europaea]|uniref:PWWP domain-containing protein n=1 Tax=Cuscuta europaea TaxID=41803 RepID=A0A9P0Z975_CUSEU|nr:unnamed protein product [Cuscuta europaea]